MLRRTFLQQVISTSLVLALLPLKTLAATWNKLAFEAKGTEQALRNMGVSHPKASKEILLTLPDRAENGAIVQAEISSLIPNTESIAILVDQNPTALIAQFTFLSGVDPFVITRIKMSETSVVTVLVKANGQYFSAEKKVEVLENGCG